jgi:hypothetical protein
MFPAKSQILTSHFKLIRYQCRMGFTRVSIVRHRFGSALVPIPMHAFSLPLHTCRGGGGEEWSGDACVALVPFPCMLSPAPLHTRRGGGRLVLCVALVPFPRAPPFVPIGTPYVVCRPRPGPTSTFLPLSGRRKRPRSTSTPLPPLQDNPSPPRFSRPLLLT